MSKVKFIPVSRCQRRELEDIERAIKRADKQKKHQPLHKKMTTDAYERFLSQKGT